MGQKEKRYSFVLVDDDPWALKAIKEMTPFEELGFEQIAEYTSAEAALKGIEQLRPHLVLSDIYMGGASGLDLIESCRRKGLPCEFIIISGYADFEYARKALHADVCTYLLKPIDRAEAREALSRARCKIENRRPTPEKKQTVLEEIRDYVRLHYQERLSLEDVAERFYLNHTYLSEMFREKFGMNFVQYKNEVRIEQAKMMLIDTELSVSQIAAQCGFDNTSYFAMVFKQLTGQSPTQYRNKEK